MAEAQSSLLLKKQLKGKYFYFVGFNVLMVGYVSIDLQKNPVEGFSAGLVNDDDIYTWEVLIIGPPDTLL